MLPEQFLRYISYCSVRISQKLNRKSISTVSGINLKCNRMSRVSILGFLLTCLLVLATQESVLSAAPDDAKYGSGTVVGLQEFKTVQSINVDLPGKKSGEVTLINLNANINRWYILRLSQNRNKKVEEFHIENPYPQNQMLMLDDTSTDKMVLTRDSEALDCPSWNLFENGELIKARKSRQIYAPLCNGSLFLRNPTKGHKTNIETVTEILRDRLPGGESVVGFVKDTFFKDKFLEKTNSRKVSESLVEISQPDFPAPASVSSDYANQMILPDGLGIQVDKETQGMLTGKWYAVKDNSGIFISLIQPKAVTPELLDSHGKRVSRLDRIEAGALAYLIAFDLSSFDLGFTIGTEHPRVGWSKRTLNSVKVPNSPGPDGFKSILPLIPNGMVNPGDSTRTVASFTGGFKRSHSAFKYGKFAKLNKGSHYGFIESGVVLSTLQPGLATLVVYDDGTIEMKTWSQEDNVDLKRIVHARQNGVPIIDWDSSTQQPIPGELVAKWGAGNWSGSQNMKLRTLRAGAAIQHNGNKQFLIYGYFSTATPSAMARIFQAYNCQYALHLDMNALEHTYLALYLRKDKHMTVQHLIQGMSVLDKSRNGSYIPRFLGYPDNRDFFYLMRRRLPQDNITQYR